MKTANSFRVGDTVRLLDRSRDVRGTVLRVSDWREIRPIEVQLIPGRTDSRFWFSEDELERLDSQETK